MSDVEHIIKQHSSNTQTAPLQQEAGPYWITRPVVIPRLNLEPVHQFVQAIGQFPHPVQIADGLCRMP